MTLVLDAGALIALERDDRLMWERLRRALRTDDLPVTHGGVIAQVWRGGSGRQARLARCCVGSERCRLMKCSDAGRVCCWLAAKHVMP